MSDKYWEEISVTVLRSTSACKNKEAIVKTMKGIIPDGPIEALELSSGMF